MNAAVMAPALGAALAVGLLLVLSACSPAPTHRDGLTSRFGGRWRVTAAEAGVPALSLSRLVFACLACAGAVFVTVLTLSGSVAVSAVVGLLASPVPVSLVQRRRRQRRDELRGLWPDVIDDLASAVRAGLSLPQALEQLGRSGPAPLRGPFSRFAETYRAGGRFSDALDVLKADLADPVGDRVVEALRVAREVGGNDLGRVLRTLASFLREDARTRGELVSRQSWTVNAARLAVAAPWLLLLMLCTRPTAVAAYDSRAGVLVLVLGAAASFVAYRLMIRIGRLPSEPRVLR